MKKTLSLFAIILCFAFKVDAPQKPLILEGDLQSFQALIDCIENSNEPHIKVEAVKKWILPQLQKQLSDSTKKK